MRQLAIQQSQPRLTVIVPVGEGELAWRELLGDLSTQSDPEFKIILVGVNSEQSRAQNHKSNGHQLRVSWVFANKGRAQQQNYGAAVAKTNVLCFLHADSRLSPNFIANVKAAVNLADRKLYFGSLAFDGLASHKTRLNAWGAWIRARLLGLPFGDQCFVIKRGLFFALGGFKTGLPYGEDHDFVWRCRHNHISLQSFPETIITSARKYARQGWVNTTTTHLRLTVVQAWPHFLKKLRGS